MDREAGRGSRSIELLEEAIEQLTQSSNGNTSLTETQILTNLISQLEREKEREGEASLEILAREVREVERQNRVTHWLLSGLIVVTMVWQISEGLLIIKLRDGVKHPFKSLWSWFTHRRHPITIHNNKNTNAIKDTLFESPYRLTNSQTSSSSHTDFQLPQLQLPTLLSVSPNKSDE